MATIVAMSLGLVACGGSTKPAEEAPATEEVAKEEVAIEKSLVDQYEELIDKSIALQEKVKAGDVSVQEEYQKLAADILKFTQDNQEALANMSEEDAKKFQEIAQKAVDAATK